METPNARVKDLGGKSDETEASTSSESPSPHSSSRSSSEIDPCEWVQAQIIDGTDPRVVLRKLLHPSCQLPPHLDDVALWRLVLQLLTEPAPRQKLAHVNSLEDIVKLIATSSRIIVLSGAGISVSCGIPDFRSRDGLYAKLAQQFPELPDPHAIFDIEYFRDDPHPFFKCAKELFPGQYTPSLSHRFVAALEKRGKLLRNYTQNIDTLEVAAGIKRAVFCHGSFDTAKCISCDHGVKGEVLREDVLNERIPMCPKCDGVLKPDIVFFGEGLPQSFQQHLQSDKLEADLLIVMGSSLKVRPVSLIPSVLPHHVPQVLINREHLGHMTFDVELLGYSDAIVSELCHCLGPDWMCDIAAPSDEERAVASCSASGVYVFPGAIIEHKDLAAEAEEDGPSIKKAKVDM
ncbi:hypothetical protein EMCRGX_G006491 [Ephydatia muelleri]